jgi:hypothetical protein
MGHRRVFLSFYAWQEGAYQETRPIEPTTGFMRHDLPKRTLQEEREAAAQGITAEARKRMDD